ncbi:hypothetical protein Ate02nite_51370 [Paractinoplanes tereljensis]|uniref:Uncharacterized protein n=1 Tax=Paractinoplanes tereljensis TaxID=571912 RepID=A0A919NRS5_9ACTN|nr:hypothetical protein Ate02nite_51370 [Actinoplanes tereljensis]
MWAALIGLAAGVLGSALKYALDRRAKAYEDLWSRRLEHYRGVWEASALFSRWPRQEPTLDNIRTLQTTLRTWYYGDGGMLMSAKARRRYEYVQKSLTAIDGTGPDQVGDDDYTEMMEIFSRLRSALTDDLESRRKGSILYTLLDLARDRRVHNDLDNRYQKVLTRHRPPKA